MIEVRIRDYKDVPLDGGTLLVSVPAAGMACVVVTDAVLEQLDMDQLAALDSDALPPLATLLRGRARYPFRIHADPKTRVAVLRGEFPLPAPLARPLARAAIDWARRKGIRRVVALDSIIVDAAAGAAGTRAPGVWMTASHDETRRVAAKAGIPGLDRGVLAGVPAMLLLESRFTGADVVVLVCDLASPLDDMRAVLPLARALPVFVPGLRVDTQRLEEGMQQVEAAVRSLRADAARAAERLSSDDTGSPPMYG